MAEVIVVRPGTAAWDKLHAVRPGAEWTEFTLPDALAHQLGVAAGTSGVAGTVQKYLGETEEGLARLFERAEDGGAVLLFDEADALFGKRTEVQSAHDRYANVEGAYLLTRADLGRELPVPKRSHRWWQRGHESSVGDTF